MSGLVGSELLGAGSVRLAGGSDDSNNPPAPDTGLLTPQQLGLDWWGAMKNIFAARTQLPALKWAAETSRGESEDFNAADGGWINDTICSGAGAACTPAVGTGSVMTLLGPNQLTQGFARWFPGAGAGPSVIAKFTGNVQSGEGAVFGYLADPGALLASTIPPENTPQLYPTAARTFTTLRVTAAGGGMTTDYTVTLYKNGVATTQQVTVPAGTAAETVIVDAAHPIAFAAGDKYDVRWDNNAGGAFKAVAVTLEGGAPAISDQLWSIRQRRWMACYRLATVTGPVDSQPFVAGLANIVGGAPALKFGIGCPDVATGTWCVTINSVKVFDTGVPFQGFGTPRDYMIDMYLACFDGENLVCNLNPGTPDQVAGAMDVFNPYTIDCSARPYVAAETLNGLNFSNPGLYVDKAMLIKEL